MSVLTALASLILASAPVTPEAQTLNATGLQVKSTFSRLENAWSRLDSRPTFLLNQRWSFVGAFVAAPTSGFNWAETLSEDQEMKFSIAGDNSVQAISVTVRKEGQAGIVMDEATGEPFMSDTFVAPSNGRYVFTISCQKGLTRPAFFLMSVESSVGHAVNKGTMAELGETVGLVYSEATGAGGLGFAKNNPSLFGGAFEKSGSKRVVNLPTTKLPAAFIGAFEGNRETFQISVTDSAGKVEFSDPGDEELPYVLVDRAVPKAILLATNRSAKPRICFVAGFQAK